MTMFPTLDKLTEEAEKLARANKAHQERTADLHAETNVILTRIADALERIADSGTALDGLD